MYFKGYKEPGRINLDIKMSQMIHLTMKTKSINCRLKDNLKEKFYNFSLKMITKEQEFLSDHSFNYKNMIVGQPPPEKSSEENRDENYQMIMDENKILQTAYFASDVNKNNPLVRTDFLDNEREYLEINEDLPHPIIQSRPSLTGLRTGANAKMNSILARNKDIVWDFTENFNAGVTLEVTNLINLKPNHNNRQLEV